MNYASIISSIREIEVVISVVIIFSLSDEWSNHMKGSWDKSESSPYSHSEVNNPSLDEEFAGSTIHELEQPLLGGIWSMRPNVAPSITWFLIEILFSVPSSVLHSWYSETFTVYNSHVLGVSSFIMSKSSSYSQIKIWSGFVIKYTNKIITYLWRPLLYNKFNLEL